MGAHVDTAFSDGFMLTEENLIKLDDIIRKRVSPSLGAPILEYRVFRADDFYVDYQSVADVIQEENAQRNLIMEIEVSIDADALKLRLFFSKRSLSSLRIEADDRDLAFLLASDIKDYLRSDVLIKSRFFNLFAASESNIEIIGVLVVIAVMGVLTYTLVWGAERPKQQLLESKDILDKLNYLLVHQSVRPETKVMPYLMIPMLFVVALFGMSEYKEKIGPKKIFYFGKEIGRYEKKKTLREKVFWGIVVTFIVGVLGTAFFELVIRR